MKLKHLLSVLCLGFGLTLLLLGVLAAPFPDQVQAKPLAQPTEADLEVSKSASAQVVQQGDTVNYTVVITNNGPLDTTLAVTLTDTIVPTTAVQSLSLPGGCTQTGAGTIECVVTIPAGTPPTDETLTFGLNTAPGFTGAVLNTAVVNSSASDPTPSNNVDAVVIAVTDNPQSDLEVSKSADAQSVQQGDTINYTVVITNNGPLATTLAVTLTDTIVPTSAIQSLSLPGGCTQTGAGTIECVVTIPGGVPPNAETLTFGLNTDPGFEGVVVNTAAVDGPVLDTSPTNNVDTVATIVTNKPQTDLVVSKSADAQIVQQGETINYTVVITNEDLATTLQVTLTDMITPTTAIQSLSLPGGCTQTGAGTIECVVTIPGGVPPTAETLTFGLNTAPAFEGVVVNTAAVDGPIFDTLPTNNVAVATTIVTANPQGDLAVSKAADAQSVGQGDTINYTVVVTNNGPLTTTLAVTLTDTIVPTSAVQSLSLPGGCTQTGAGSIECVVTIPAGTPPTAETLTFSLNTDPAFEGVVVNTAAVEGPVFDTSPTNNVDAATTIVTDLPFTDLVVDKSANVPAVQQGDTISYTVVITNEGPLTTTLQVTLTDTITPTTAIQPLTNLPGGCTQTGAGAFECVVTIPGGTPPNAASLTFALDTTDTYTGPVANTAIVDGPIFDTGPLNNIAVAATVVTELPPADLAVNKTADAQVVQPGDTINYTVVITNEGPLATTLQVTLTDTITPTAAIQSLSLPGGCTQTGAGAFECVVTIPAGTPPNAASLAFALDTTDTYTGPVANTADVDGLVFELNIANNSSRVVVGVGSIPFDIYLPLVLK